jgi:methionyl-tRNA formyltransferase
MMTNQKTSSIPFVFFGSSPLSVVALDTLEKRGMMPVLVVTAPDKKKGRGLGLSPNGVRAWADLRGIPAAMPEKLDAAADLLKRSACEYFIVVAYGKIIPKTILDIPPRGALNIHPSLSPVSAVPLPSALPYSPTRRQAFR